MISHGKEIKVFSGNSNPKLANQICNQLFKNLGDCTCAHFADGECSISVHEPVRLQKTKEVSTVTTAK